MRRRRETRFLYFTFFFLLRVMLNCTILPYPILTYPILTYPILTYAGK